MSTVSIMLTMSTISTMSTMSTMSIKSASITSGKKITNEKVFKYQSAGDKTIEIVKSAKLPQLAHHLRPIFGLVILKALSKNVWCSLDTLFHLHKLKIGRLGFGSF